MGVMNGSRGEKANNSTRVLHSKFRPKINAADTQSELKFNISFLSPLLLLCRKAKFEKEVSVNIIDHLLSPATWTFSPCTTFKPKSALLKVVMMIKFVEQFTGETRETNFAAFWWLSWASLYENINHCHSHNHALRIKFPFAFFPHRRQLLSFENMIHRYERLSNNRSLFPTLLLDIYYRPVTSRSFKLTFA